MLPPGRRRAPKTRSALSPRTTQVLRVGSDCTLVHGENLKQFLGGEAGMSASGGGGYSGSGGGGSSSGGGGGSAGGSRSSDGISATAAGAGSGSGSGPVGGGMGAGDAWWLECFAVSGRYSGGRCLDGGFGGLSHSVSFKHSSAFSREVACVCRSALLTFDAAAYFVWQDGFTLCGSKCSAVHPPWYFSFLSPFLWD